MGTEFKGASERMLEAADYHVFIPMLGMAESLNIIAAGMIMHRIMENMRALPPETWQLNADEKGGIAAGLGIEICQKIRRHFEAPRAVISAQETQHLRP